MKRILSVVLAVLIFMGVMSTMTFATDSSVSSKMGENSYTVMGSNILMVQLYEKETPKERFEQIMTAFEEKDPDIFGLQECDEMWHDVLDGEKGFVTLGYAPAVTGYGDLRNPIYYKTDKFKVLNCGFEKYKINSSYSYTWALFEVTKTGERFIVVCTHLTWMDYDKSVDDAEAAELIEGVSALEAKYDLPAVIVGDFNSTMKEAAYKRMASAYSSARDCAGETVNMEYKTMAKPGKVGNAPDKGDFVLDHIFYTPDEVMGERYEVFVGPEVYAYSDHMPQMLRFRLRHQHTFDTLSDKGETHVGVCKGCGETVTAEHKYIWEFVDSNSCHGTCACGKNLTRGHVFDLYETSEKAHSVKCACGLKGKTASHKFDDGVVTREATHTLAGQITYTCAECKKEKYEEIAVLPVPESGYELEGFGQKHFEAYITANEPVCDGIIGDGEYSLAIENMTYTSEDQNENVFIVNSIGRVESMSAYVTATEDVIAVAFKIKVDGAKVGDIMVIDLGFKKETDKFMRYHFVHNNAGGTLKYGYEANEGYVKSYKVKHDSGYITYELVLRRAMIERYADGELDKMYLRAIASAPKGTGTEELWFGFASGAPLNTVHTMTHNRYPHVISFLEAVPVETETESETVTETETATATETETEEAAGQNSSGCGASATGVAFATAIAACAVVTKKRKEDR